MARASILGEVVGLGISGSVALSRCASFAGALTSAIRRTGNFSVDGLRFERRADIPETYDCVSTGRHTLVFELAGAGKTYRISIEPVAETHR